MSRKLGGLRASTLVAACAVGAFSLAAQAQPAATDLGTLSVPSTTFTPQISGGTTGIVWYTFVIPQISSTTNYLDLTTLFDASTAPDTEIGLYDIFGNRIAEDDDDGPALLSSLSFGFGCNPRPNIGFGTQSVGAPFNGRDGASLPAGRYYMAVGRFNTTFAAANWDVTTTSTAVLDGVYTRIDLGSAGAFTPPAPTTTAGAATPSSALAGTTVLFTVTVPSCVVLPGDGSVSIDLSSIGGPSAQAMFDDGTNGDVLAGNNVFSYAYTIPNTLPVGGTFTIPVSVQNSSGSTSRNLTVTVSIPTGPCCIGGTVSELSASACASAGGTYGGDSQPIFGTLGPAQNSTSGEITLIDFAGTTPGVVSDSIFVSSSETVENLVLTLDIRHTWVGDLIVTLSNGSVTADVLVRLGSTTTAGVGDSSNLDGVYNFYDSASGDILAESLVGGTDYVIRSGNYRPRTFNAESSLSVFNGQPASGTWTLTISDNAGSDTGALRGWRLHMNNQASCETTPPPCPADFNGDDAVNTADITAFLSAWFAARANGTTGAADFNTDGTVNTADITAFLSAWFAARAGGC